MSDKAPGVQNRKDRARRLQAFRAAQRTPLPTREDVESEADPFGVTEEHFRKNRGVWVITER